MAEGGSLLLNGAEAAIGSTFDGGLLANQGTRNLVVALSTGDVLNLKPTETVVIAPGGENQVRKCACKCNGHLKYPQGITNAESCKAINGQSCVDGDDIFKYTDCSWAWTDAWIVLRP